MNCFFFFIKTQTVPLIFNFNCRKLATFGKDESNHSDDKVGDKNVPKEVGNVYEEVEIEDVADHPRYANRSDGTHRDKHANTHQVASTQHTDNSQITHLPTDHITVINDENEVTIVENDIYNT